MGGTYRGINSRFGVKFDPIVTVFYFVPFCVGFPSRWWLLRLETCGNWVNIELVTCAS